MLKDDEYFDLNDEDENNDQYDNIVIDNPRWQYGLYAPMYIGYTGSFLLACLECLALLNILHESALSGMVFAIVFYWLAFIIRVLDKAHKIFYVQRIQHHKLSEATRKKWWLFSCVHFSFGMSYSIFLFVLWALVNNMHTGV